MLLDRGDERPDLGNVHLLDRLRLQIGLGQKRRQVEVRLEADVNRERGDEALDARQQRVRAEKVVQEDDAAHRAGTRGAFLVRP